MDGFSPQMPLPVLGAGTLVFLAMLALLLRRARGLSLVFLLCAVWLRVMFAAFQQITTVPIAAGFTLNALLSIATVFAGVALVPTRSFRERWALPIYLLFALILASGVYNRAFGGTVDALFKWGYLFVILAATRQAVLDNGLARTLQMLMLCYAPIFTFQLASIGLGVAKATEADGSTSYIGGYKHEAIFSVLVVTFLTFVSLNVRGGFLVRAGLFAMGFASLMLANYRTSILAALPLAFGFALFAGVNRFTPRQRNVLLLLLLPPVLVGFAAAMALPGFQARFADMFRVFADTDLLFKSPTDFTRDEERILSGRLVIWSRYIHGYLDGDLMQRLIGRGANSWVGVMTIYAHNTIVSFLYEYGALGVALIVTIWATFIRGASRIADPAFRAQVLLAQTGFLILNMATMPHWQIEGTIMFAVCSGVVVAMLQREASERAGASRGPARRDGEGRPAPGWPGPAARPA